MTRQQRSKRVWAKWGNLVTEQVRSGQSVAAMTLLKGHLVLEEKITASIEKYVFNAEALENARLIFSHKLSIARSISLDESKNSMWSFPCCEDFAGCLRSISSMIRSAQRLASEIAPPAVAASSPSHGTTRQAGHKALHRLGNAPAAPQSLWAANSAQNRRSRADGVHRLFDVRGIGTDEGSRPKCPAILIYLLSETSEGRSPAYFFFSASFSKNASTARRISSAEEDPVFLLMSFRRFTWSGRR